MEKIKRFLARASDRGASLVEYALLVALIAVVCIAAVTRLGAGASTEFDSAGSGIGGGEEGFPQGGCPEGQHRGIGSHTDDEGNPEPSDSCYSNTDVFEGSQHMWVGMAP